MQSRVPRRKGEPPRASLHFRYSESEIEAIRRRVMADWQAEKVRERNSGHVLPFLGWMTAFLLVFGYLSWIFDWGAKGSAEGFDFVTYAMAAGTAIVVLIGIIVPTYYLSILRPLKRRRLSIRRGRKAKIGRYRGIPQLKLGLGFRFGDRWLVSASDAKRVVEGERYDAYFVGDRLFYLEPTPPDAS